MLHRLQCGMCWYHAGEQAGSAAHAAHDLTADEDESQGGTWNAVIAEYGPLDYAAPDTEQVAHAAIEAVERTLGPLESCKPPASAPDASGVFSSGLVRHTCVHVFVALQIIGAKQLCTPSA